MFSNKKININISQNKKNILKTIFKLISAIKIFFFKNLIFLVCSITEKVVIIKL